MIFEIYTSYFDNIKNLPLNFEPIAICGAVPDYWSGKWIKKLAPKRKFFQEWKYNNRSNNYYITHFKREILDYRNSSEIVYNIFELCKNKIPCLICYEKPNEFCHRHLVSHWLQKNINNLKCEEFLCNNKNI